MKYEHDGKTIELDAGSGKFSTLISGVRKTFTSLGGAKAAITKAAQSAFIPFDVIEEPRWGVTNKEPFVVRRVIGINKGKGTGYRNRAKFVLDGGSERESVTPDTPDNRAAFMALHEWNLETTRIKKERDAYAETLDAALSTRLAEDEFKP